MFYAKFKEANIFKKLIDSIKELVTDVNLDISFNGVSMQAMDSSHVALVSLCLSYDDFQDYRCDKQMVLGLNIQQVSKILKCCNNEDSLILKVDEDNNQIHFVFEDESHKKTSEFYLSLINFDGEHLGIPDSLYHSIVKINSNEFTRICKELYSLSETVRIETSKNHISFSFLSEQCRGSINLSQNDEHEEKDDYCDIKVSECVCQGFAMKYLNSFTKGHSISKFVTINLSNESPLMVEYKLEKFGYLRFYLAPRITDDK